MEIEMARELLKLFVENDYNVHLHIFAVHHNLTLASILGLAHTEYMDKLLLAMKRSEQ